MVALHPSCGLETQPEWVIFNEFVLTTRLYIRTVTVVRLEWYEMTLIFLPPYWITDFCYYIRLLEYAAAYFDLKSFPDRKTKHALSRAANRRAGKVGRLNDKQNGSGKRPKKKRPKKKRKKVA